MVHGLYNEVHPFILDMVVFIVLDYFLRLPPILFFVVHHVISKGIGFLSTQWIFLQRGFLWPLLSRILHVSLRSWTFLLHQQGKRFICFYDKRGFRSGLLPNLLYHQRLAQVILLLRYMDLARVATPWQTHLLAINLVRAQRTTRLVTLRGVLIALVQKCWLPEVFFEDFMAHLLGDSRDNFIVVDVGLGFEKRFEILIWISATDVFGGHVLGTFGLRLDYYELIVGDTVHGLLAFQGLVHLGAARKSFILQVLQSLGFILKNISKLPWFSVFFNLVLDRLPLTGLRHFVIDYISNLHWQLPRAPPRGNLWVNLTIILLDPFWAALHK